MLQGIGLRPVPFCMKSIERKRSANKNMAIDNINSRRDNKNIDFDNTKRYNESEKER